MDNPSRFKTAAHIFDLYAKFWSLDVLVVGRKTIMDLTNAERFHDTPQEDLKRAAEFHFGHVSLIHGKAYGFSHAVMVRRPLEHLKLTDDQQHVLLGQAQYGRQRYNPRRGWWYHPPLKEETHLWLINMRTNLISGSARLNLGVYGDEVSEDRFRKIRGELLDVVIGDTSVYNLKLLHRAPRGNGYTKYQIVKSAFAYDRTDDMAVPWPPRQEVPRMELEPAN